MQKSQEVFTGKFTCLVLGRKPKTMILMSLPAKYKCIELLVLSQSLQKTYHLISKLDLIK